VFYLKGLFFVLLFWDVFVVFGFWVCLILSSALVLIDEMIGECELKWLEVN